MKTYKRRDSATSFLRTLGVKVRDYNLFITKAGNGVQLDDELAKKHVADLKKQAAKPAKKTKKSKEKRVTISSLCRDMILDGATNEQIFAALQEKYGEERFDEGKCHYPAWYRCELRRKGALPPAFDPVNKDPNAVHRFED